MWTILVTAISFAALVLIGAPFVETALMYHPDTGYVHPQAAGLGNVTERRIASGDGTEVLAWYAPARPGQRTILYFHGNGGSLVTRSERMRKYIANGRGMLMMTYRGYGGSKGKPSERANVADALAAYDLLIAEGVAADDIVLYGESLGSGVAVQVARARKVAGLILDAPYTSTVDVAALIYPWLPVRALMRDRYETKRHIAGVTAPLLVVHGDRDMVIPVEMGRAVHAAAPGEKQLAIIPMAGHADHHLYGSYEVIGAWLARLDEKRARREG